MIWGEQVEIADRSNCFESLIFAKNLERKSLISLTKKEVLKKNFIVSSGCDLCQEQTVIRDGRWCRSYQSPCIFLFFKFFKNLKIKKKIFILWLLWSFISVCRLSLALVSGGYSLVEVCGPLIKVALRVAECGCFFSEVAPLEFAPALWYKDTCWSRHWGK